MVETYMPRDIAGDFPTWVPVGVRHYLIHTERGISIRALARRRDCHPSTVMRQVRKLETQRDDQLVDEGLRDLACRLHPGDALAAGAAAVTERRAVTAFKTTCSTRKEHHQMSFQSPDSDRVQHIPSPQDREAGDQPLDDEVLEREARRVLRRLGESGAVLAVASAMDKAVVVREGLDGENLRTAVVDRPVAQALALKEWITCRQPGKVARYVITQAGRMALNRMQAAAENAASAAAQGLAEDPADFRGKDVVGANMTRTAQRKRQSRFSQSDSPLVALSRRRDKDGSYFLTSDLVIAGERLREDFELSQMGPRTTQNWDHFLTGPIDGIEAPGSLLGGSSAARDRVAGALRELGPGLGDVALRCCCYLEGLEQCEKKLGWAARSGKIVLRIALQRLKRYYDGMGPGGGMIG